ncbi:MULTISPECIES: glycosyltransferase family 4 protein [unclassified Vibrio]|uniref:Glycosyltransferase family 4 protein n=1 Tax=Vibrio sp. HB236076 TaxID=3232307 RepID=A0AB39H959_9VIBR|nr:glycosyltransferase family 4 protein [Vibrio sp. HB161653]MDP5255401.1 glycosyltransferase family 4 protein [Vibrio sp. HB161653]
MKIALVHMRHAKVGGTELFLNQIAKYLCEKGEDVTIICRTHEEPSHPKIKFQVLKPLSIGKAHRVYRFAKAVEKHIKHSDYDIVYALGKTWTHDLIRVGGGTRKHIVDLRKAKKPTLRDRVSMYIERKALSENDNLYVISNSYKSTHEIQADYSVPHEKLITIHNAVDTNRFDRRQYQKETDNIKKKIGITNANLPTFLFLGSGYNRKGLEPTLNAFSNLPFDANLVIVGNESNPEKYHQLAQTLGIDKRCFFLGKQENPEHYFALADCYVFPTKYEPFGFTAIEALSSGCPVITTQDCGAKEVMNENVSTILGTGFTTEELTNAMIKWVQNQPKDLPQQCRESVMKLDVEAIMEENYQVILDAYKLKKKM